MAAARSTDGTASEMAVIKEEAKARIEAEQAAEEGLPSGRSEIGAHVQGEKRKPGTAVTKY